MGDEDLFCGEEWMRDACTVRGAELCIFQVDNVDRGTVFSALTYKCKRFQRTGFAEAERDGQESGA